MKHTQRCNKQQIVKFKIRKQIKKFNIMKKLILGMAVMVGSFAFAQQTPAKSSSPIKFGVKAGMNVASISKTEGLDDQKSKIGFYAGGFANIPIASSFSVQPELIYSGLGSKVDDTTETTIAGVTTKTKTSASTNLNYLAVPVMFQYNFVPNFYVEAGPEFGFLLGGKYKGDSTTTVTDGTTTSTSTSNVSEEINKDHYNTFNVGIGLGAGYYFTDNIGVTARYVAGVTKLGKNDNAVGNYYKDSKNNVFQVGLAFKF